MALFELIGGDPHLISRVPGVCAVIMAADKTAVYAAHPLGAELLAERPTLLVSASAFRPEIFIQSHLVSDVRFFQGVMGRELLLQRGPLCLECT